LGVIDYEITEIRSRSVREQAQGALDSLGLRRAEGRRGGSGSSARTPGDLLLIVGDLSRFARGSGLDRIAAAPPWVSYVLLVRTQQDRRLLGEPDVALQLNERLQVLDLTAAGPSPPSALPDHLRALVERLRPDRVRAARFAPADGVLWLEFGDGVDRAVRWAALSFAPRTGFCPVSAAAREHGHSVLLVDRAGDELTVDSAVLRAEVDATFRDELDHTDAQRRAEAGARLRKVRQARGLSRQDLAARSGIPQETLSRLETGRRDPRPDTLRKLAAGLGIAVAELLEELSVTSVSASAAVGTGDRRRG